MGVSLYSIECSCISKFVLIQHILSTQVSDIGPMAIWIVVVVVRFEVLQPVPGAQSTLLRSSRSVNVLN